MSEIQDEVTEGAILAFIEKVSMPFLRAVATLAVLWISGKAVANARLASGMIVAVLSFFLTFTFLESLFYTVGIQLAVVALFILCINGALVGMSIGVLMPFLAPGMSFGLALALLVAAFLPTSSTLYFSITAPVAAVIGGIISARFHRPIMLALATVLVGGGVAACCASPNLFPYLMDVARGYAYHPQDITILTEKILNFPPHITLGLAWVSGSVLTIVSLFIRDTDVRHFRLFSKPQSSSNGTANKGGEPPFMYNTPPSSLEAYNMFDPADLPPRLAEYANMVYSACEDLGNFFGFQDSSVRNQAEHILILLSNHRRYMSSHILQAHVQPPSPIHAMHAKMFSNYMKWCRAMGVPPNFSKMNSSMSAPPAVASRVVDLVLWFCIWGEGANLRHMPECMWFLYHKMMEEYTLSEGYTQTRSLYAGHYLDQVVNPIFKIVEKSMKGKNDHPEKLNYDDFNEFFWSKTCLNFRYTAEIVTGDVEMQGQMNTLLPGDGAQCIAEGLGVAPKTFLEKRSWLRGTLAIYRILEWHIVTFYLLAVIAFSRQLVWGWVFSLEVASGVFWVFNSLHLLRELLEVWAVFPGIQLNGIAICGSVFVLASRFLILVYQTLYLMSAFGPEGKTYLNITEDSNFWWWQYIWLSIICMVPYILQAFAQLYPPLTSWLYTNQNDFVQSFLQILFPLSRLYVGKEVHESFKHTAVYFLFWVTLIAWKLYFSYMFEVWSMVLPTLELSDDYVNFSNEDFYRMTLLLLLRWTPQFIVYLIDMSIWYAVWQGFAGTSVGFSEHLGDIRSFKDIRDNFVLAPEKFCRKMLSPDAGSRRGSSASFLGASNPSMSATTASDESQRLLGGDAHKLQSYVNRLLEVKIQKWVMFSAVWNEIIDMFRQEDIVSNQERDNLKFSVFDGFSQAIYLPVFQTAGVIENVLHELERPQEEYMAGTENEIVTDGAFFGPVLSHLTMCTAVSEVWELGTFLFLQILGPVHNDDIVAVMKLILKWSQNGALYKNMKMDKVRSAMTQFVGLVNTLKGGIGRRKPASAPRVKSSKPKFARNQPQSEARPGMRRAVSAAFLQTMSKGPSESNTFSKKKDTSEVDAVILDALRDQVRDKFRNLMQSVKGLLKDTSNNPETRDILDRITFLLSKEDGFIWDDAYASDQLDDVSKKSLFKDVLSKVHGLVACHPDDVEPKSKEVHRRLTFFVNSLFMDMPDAPSIHDMFSWNVMTPYYSEDVTYTKGDLIKRSDALGVSTLLYLQTLFRADWNNFLERMKIQDDEIWGKKNLGETRTWASLRAQTLSRTVHGMMYYEKALRLLANLERLDENTTNDLMGEKFGYIVSCQVYGNMKKNQDSKAEDIENLMHRFPHLRIAYIDSIRLNRAGAAVFYSVLVKSDGNGKIQEVYRVRLPGNPVIGEGKPENQNHAMIFSRGEFVQTIDMNQEGYFEEALKMRNALQEFAKRDGPLPTTILGLREHIFTGSVSSLANYMALQETSFVTLGQRVLTNPLCIRLHYGHPDVFDKLFFITRGGISKSSKGINLSEDIFAGYNNAIRGGQVGFKEYLQVGKGRDVGMSQIYKFEAKLSQGAGEQSLSRDVYRLCHRLDFYRLLSMYFGGIGHYFSNVLTILTIYIVIYLMAILALFDLEKIGDRLITPMGTIQMLLGGLGLLQTIPLFATLGVERGWWDSLREIFYVFITGGPLHFMFHIQTKAHYMSQTILVGGAKYRATGRGFVTQHTEMDEQFRFFASSHLYLGVEIGTALILMGIFTDAGQYFGRTWSMWLASISFLASPFWFNPLTFDWSVVTSDYGKYIRWMCGSGGNASKSWDIWWTEENAYYKKLSLPSKIISVLKATLYVIMAIGIWGSDLWSFDSLLNKPTIAINLLVIVIVAAFIIGRILAAIEHMLSYPLRRTLGLLIAFSLIAGIIILISEDSNYLRKALAAYYGVGAICLIGLLTGVKAVKNLYFIHDLVCGHIIFVPLFIFAALQVPSYIQTWLLYKNALSSDVVISDILKYAQKSQNSSSGKEGDEDLAAQVAELRKIVQKQEQMLMNNGVASNLSTDDRNASTDAIMGLISEPAQAAPVMPRAPEVPRGPARAMSMSGLDVWGDMALGDADEDSSPYSLHQVEPPRAPQMGHAVQGFHFESPSTMPPR
uniref:1,3-beta-glucan synthase n=1 Tax=Ditylum brightwellii TaxID=49249 RepID=A0A7S1ZKM7_9STRA|mmetsp:Transcript_3345/g.5086  ORF Transcript_3345/g.5086 Transcript_3345/m.5086 type:complete len:2138 (+) Transcript_3345:308-6721(+)